MKHLLVDVYEHFSNKSPRIKIGPAPEVIEFFLFVYSENLENFLVKKNKRART
jgi:hypothetical protein